MLFDKFCEYIQKTSEAKLKKEIESEIEYLRLRFIHQTQRMMRTEQLRDSFLSTDFINQHPKYLPPSQPHLKVIHHAPLFSIQSSSSSSSSIPHPPLILQDPFISITHKPFLPTRLLLSPSLSSPQKQAIQSEFSSFIMHPSSSSLSSSSLPHSLSSSLLLQPSDYIFASSSLHPLLFRTPKIDLSFSSLLPPSTTSPTSSSSTSPSSSSLSSSSSSSSSSLPFFLFPSSHLPILTVFHSFWTKPSIAKKGIESLILSQLDQTHKREKQLENLFLFDVERLKDEDDYVLKEKIRKDLFKEADERHEKMKKEKEMEREVEQQERRRKREG